MPDKITIPAAPAASSGLPRSIRHLFWGAALGLAIGLGAAFALALLDA